MAEVFISHHVGTAEKTVREIAEKLEQRGITCWYCERDEKGGNLYLEKIAQEIESCRVFLLVMNRPAMQSDIINREIHLMQECIQEGQNITRLQYRLEECRPTPAIRLIFAGIHYMNGTTDEVVERTAEILGKTKIIHEPEIQRHQNIEEMKKELSDITRCYFPDSDNLWWGFQDGGLVVGGEGLMPDWMNNNPPWYNLRYKITFIWIQDGVTGIGDVAFRACSNLTDVIIPESMTWIGLYAFWGCEKLKSVKVPHHTIVCPNAFPESTKIIQY